MYNFLCSGLITKFHIEEAINFINSFANLKTSPSGNHVKRQTVSSRFNYKFVSGGEISVEKLDVETNNKPTIPLNEIKEARQQSCGLNFGNKVWPGLKPN